MKIGCNSQGIQNDQAGMNVLLIASAAEAKYKNKNASRSDGLFRNSFCEKGSLTSHLRLGLPFEEHCNEENYLPSWIKTVHGGAKPSIAQCIPRPLNLSVLGSCSNSINLLPSRSGFGSPVAVREVLADYRTPLDDDQDGCSGFVTNYRCGILLCKIVSCAFIFS